MKSNLFIHMITIAVIAVFWGCSNDDDLNEEVLPQYDRADSMNADYLRQLGNIRVSIEQTAKLNKLLFDKGFSYNSSLLMSSSKSFGNSKQQAMGLGAIGADLNYATVYEQSQDAMNYTKALMDVANKLGIGSAFDEELLNKMTSNDSTINKSILLTKAYLRAEDQLFNEERAHLATLMSVGGWIEGLSISTSIGKTKPVGNEINSGIWSQAYTYNNIIAMLKIFKDSSPDCAEVLNELIGLEPKINAVVRQGNLNEEQINNLNTAVTDLKNKLMN